MSDTEEKKHDASERKLRKQRSEGSIPGSQESTSMLGVAFGLIACSTMAMPTWLMVMDLINVTPDRFFETFDEAIEVGFNTMLTTIWMSVLPIVGVVLIVSIISTLVINKGIVFSIKPVLPDLKRVSIAAGVKRIYGKRGWKDAGVGAARLFLWLLFVTIVSLLLLPTIVKSVNCGVACQLSIASPIMSYMLLGAVVLFVIFAALDIIIQRSSFLDEQKMTNTEKNREIKDQRVSDQVLQERNRLRQIYELTGNVKLGGNDVTIAFRADQGIVGINYNPPKQPLPLICAKAKTEQQRAAFTRNMRALGVPIVDNERIVSNTIGKGHAEMLDITHFRDFALAIAPQ